MFVVIKIGDAVLEVLEFVDWGWIGLKGVTKVFLDIKPKRRRKTTE